MKSIPLFIACTLMLSAPLHLSAQDLNQDLTLAEINDEILALKEELKASQRSKTHVGGYGELHYNAGDNKTPRMDLHRFVFLMEKEISPTIRFQSELEVEHAFVQNNQGEVVLEQAYLDFQVAQGISIKGGILLVPLGIINETHEPNSFNGVERPDYAKVILPATFSAEGAGLSGRLSHSWQYKVYLLAGLSASGFRARDSIRQGRSNGFNSPAGSLALATRLHYTRPGLRIGLSNYRNNAATDLVRLDAQAKGVKLDKVQVNLTAVDFDWKSKSLALRAEAAKGTLSNTDKLNQVYGRGVGSDLQGAYLEPAVTVYAKGETESSSSLDMRRSLPNPPCPQGVSRVKIIITKPSLV